MHTAKSPPHRRNLYSQQAAPKAPTCISALPRQPSSTTRQDAASRASHAREKSQTETTPATECRPHTPMPCSISKAAAACNIPLRSVTRCAHHALEGGKLVVPRSSNRPRPPHPAVQHAAMSRVQTRAAVASAARPHPQNFSHNLQHPAEQHHVIGRGIQVPEWRR